ncbi:hypothetical protein IE4803_CH02938 [Rhizobium etli bv. phaseoli str. IE4803]|uniref:Uncharacterized protein n=1 Tax=Rhizobium etli bv. mimosae str. IE4771 TaxID=1432050 RepID=A0A060HYP4_RHIET|nr:hypothetical protein [Rhizobium sp. IE4771]AIC28063.1 hypothetical protein IE4771_CH02969 [Rhizobium sp. IE4771]AJC80122.1 hypothetical protein IE4803_CH02938 [Rhizobium etli bv. phaseoli str. IE4803]
MSVKTPSIVQRNFEEGTRPILEIAETVARLTNTKVSTIKWQKETYVPRHKKFVSDMVGVTEDGQIIHIEQETAPEGDLSVRMLEYATLIAVAFDMKQPITQYVYYTGDEPRKTKAVEHKMHWFMHKYYFLDAGSQEVCERLIKGSLPTAALSLLVRETDIAARYSTEISDRIAMLPVGQRQSAIDHCFRVASLRRRRKLFENILMSKIPYDPSLFLNPTAEAMVVDALIGQIPGAIADLSFDLSPEIEEYMLHKMGGWEMSKFLKHFRSFKSEEELMNAFDWTIEPEDKNEQSSQAENGM